MRDFLKGTLGILAQVALGILGLIFFISGFVSCGTSHTTAGGVYIFLSILCWCAIGGIRYWLGHIVRMR
jgi:drug/metabolite transporter superfamily protein YnfA